MSNIKIKTKAFEIEVPVGGLPTYDELTKNSTSTSTELDFGLERAVTKGKTGEAFEKATIDAVEYAGKEQAYTYDYAIATAGDVEFDEFLETANAKQLQKAINAFGYHLKVDGIIGKRTRKAYQEVMLEYGSDELRAEYDYIGNLHGKPKDDYMEIAKGELGTLEWKNGSNPEVEKYHNAVGGIGWDDGIPWCGSFVGYVLQRAGYPLPKHPYRALSWLDYGKKSFLPAYGAIAVKTRRGGGHVGFVIGGTADGKYVDILGGNQHDSVNVTRYRTSAFKEFRLPDGYTPDRELEPYFEAQRLISES